MKEVWKKIEHIYEVFPQGRSTQKETAVGDPWLKEISFGDSWLSEIAVSDLWLNETAVSDP